MHTESYIDDSITISEHLPSNLRWMITELEQFDKEGRAGAYLTRAEDLDVGAKNAYAEGDISKKTWNALVQKYFIHANRVMDEEDGEDSRQ